MKTLIEIDEKTVTIDGVKFVKAELEFKVGQWVIITHDGNNASQENPKGFPSSGVYKTVPDWKTQPLRIASELHPFVDYAISKGSYALNDANGVFVGYVYVEGLRPATKEEIESHLIKVAKEKGFVYGRSFKSIFTDDGEIRNIQPFNEGDEIKLMYFESEDQLYWLSGMKTYDKFCSNPTIYKAGKWAEILPSKKSLPKTKEEFESFLLEWKNTRGSESIMSFLNQYE